MNNIFHYCGHIISRDESGRFPRSNESRVQNEIESYLKHLEVDSCYGSLASGADIMFAESLVNKGAELHLILPFEKEHFIDLSVSCSGKQWIDRFRRLVNQATSITKVYCGKPKNENLSFALCTEIALGSGLIEAFKNQDERKSQLQQIALWDQQPTDGIAGTYQDMIRAQIVGLTTSYISSIQPIKSHDFVQSSNTPIQALNLVIYDKREPGKEHRTYNIEELVDYLGASSLGKNHSIDFEHNHFGRHSKIGKKIITDRALAHIFFHCYAKKNLTHRDELLRSLLRMNDSEKEVGDLNEI